MQRLSLYMVLLFMVSTLFAQDGAPIIETDTSPLAEFSIIGHVADGYVFMRESDNYTAIIYHQMTAAEPQEFILWEDNSDYHWQVVWSAADMDKKTTE